MGLAALPSGRYWEQRHTHTHELTEGGGDEATASYGAHYGARGSAKEPAALFLRLLLLI